jgi:hypothetical protein
MHASAHISRIPIGKVSSHKVFSWKTYQLRDKNDNHDSLGRILMGDKSWMDHFQPEIK